MKTCTVYILCFINDIESRELVRKLFYALRSCSVLGGTQYHVQLVFCENNKKYISSVLYNDKKPCCDVVISSGLAMTMLLKMVYATMLPIPTLFFGIYDPVAYNVVQSLKNPSLGMSGVCIDYVALASNFCTTLQSVALGASKIFMPYDTRLDQYNFSIEFMTEYIAKKLKNTGYEVRIQKIHDKSEAIEAIKDHLVDYPIVSGLGLHADTEKAAAYMCGMSERIFISAQGEAGLRYGAALAVDFYNHVKLVQIFLDKIQQHSDGRLLIDSQPVVMLCDGPSAVKVNRFMLPSWAVTLPDNSKMVEVSNNWVNCALVNKHLQDSDDVNYKKLQVVLEQISLMQKGGLSQ